VGPKERLERTQWDFFWVPRDAEIVDRPELAALRCARPVPYLNCVTRSRATAAAWPELVAEVGAFHQYGLSRWLVPDTFDTRALEAALGAAGYAPTFRHDARAVRPDEHRARAGRADVEVRRVASLAELRACVDVTSRAFGRPDLSDDIELRRQLEQCSDPRGRVHRFVAYRRGEPISSGGLSWFPDLRFGFLWAGGTTPDARGEGTYSAVVRARVEHARALGAEWIGTYALETTSSPVVARQGFERVGAMAYWER